MATALAISQDHGLLSVDAWQEVAWLPCQLQIELSIIGFTVGDLLMIEVGSIVDSHVSAQSDVSVKVNGARIGCGKLDLAGSHLGIRITELV